MGLLYYICCDEDKTLYELGKAGWYSFEQFKTPDSTKVHPKYILNSLGSFVTSGLTQFNGPREVQIINDIWERFNNKEIYIVYDADDSYDDKIDAGYKVIGSIYTAA